MWPDSGPASGTPNPPASSAGVKPRGSSISARGLPRVSATIRSRIRSSSTPGSAEASNGARVAVCEPLDEQLGETCELIRLAGLANGEHHRDPLGEQAPRHERQRLRGRAVEPLRVVDEAHQRTRLGRVGKQAQRRKGDQEVVRGSAVLHAERNPQRISLRVGDPVEAVEHRRAQLVQTRERKLHLGLHPCGSRDTTPRRLLGDVAQQRRLADPCFAAQHQDPALPDQHVGQQSVHCLALGAPAQHPRSVGRAVSPRSRRRYSPEPRLGH